MNAEEEIMSIWKKDQAPSDACSPTTSLVSEVQNDQQHADVTIVKDAPIVSSYNEKIRPLLDAVDKLRNLMVMEEGIQLPTIVVVGDQSSGKSSVLESLASISLPRGQGICTRVPLIMRLQHHSSPTPELYLEINGRTEPTDEARVAEDIVKATDEIAGGGKGISNNPLTLFVKKKGVPDLTMVDLPGITRVPVHGQPENIYDQIKEMIMHYIKPKESIILNVLSASVDFTTCESIRMSQCVDRNGERTLAVVTKVDKAPEGLAEKVLADDVSIGLGYVCVRNRIGDETYEEARALSEKLFETHPLLSKIEKSMVGFDVLANKLVKIQATSIGRSLPDIVNKIDDKLNDCVTELNKLPKGVSSFAEAITALMLIIGNSKESLRKILVRGKFDEFKDKKSMHGMARLVELLNQFRAELLGCDDRSDNVAANFLADEITVLEKAKDLCLPNFLSRSAFLVLLEGKVDRVSSIPIAFVEKAWSYIEDVMISVLLKHSENYNQLQLCIKRAGRNLIAEMKERSMAWMNEIVEMEREIDYTCDPQYVKEWERLMSDQGGFIHGVLDDKQKPPEFVVNHVGMVKVKRFRKYSRDLLTQAFDLRMRMCAYWEVVLRRLVDNMALHMKLSVSKLVNKKMEEYIVMDIMGPNNNAGVGLEKMLEDSPSVVLKREKLKKSISKLKESKEIVSKIIT